jgi:hypothetical protein
VAEDDGLARAPVLVKNRRAVPGGYGTRTHGVKSSFQDHNETWALQSVKIAEFYEVAREENLKTLLHCIVRLIKDNHHLRFCQAYNRNPFL